MEETLNRPLVKILVGEGAVVPSYRSDEAAGMDLHSTRSVRLRPLERALVPTGIRISIPRGYEAQVRPRSGLALKHGISLVNTPGTIDSDYRGEIGVILVNLGSDEVELASGERIAQLVISPVARAVLQRVDVLDETARGEGGFGSTGS